MIYYAILKFIGGSLIVFLLSEKESIVLLMWILFSIGLSLLFWAAYDVFGELSDWSKFILSGYYIGLLLLRNWIKKKKGDRLASSR